MNNVPSTSNVLCNLDLLNVFLYQQGNGLNYMDPSHLAPAGSDKNESRKDANQPTEYAQIVGVVKQKKKKKKN